MTAHGLVRFHRRRFEQVTREPAGGVGPDGAVRDARTRSETHGTHGRRVGEGRMSALQEDDSRGGREHLVHKIDRPFDALQRRKTQIAPHIHAVQQFALCSHHPCLPRGGGRHIEKSDLKHSHGTIDEMDVAVHDPRYHRGALQVHARSKGSGSFGRRALSHFYETPTLHHEVGSEVSDAIRSEDMSVKKERALRLGSVACQQREPECRADRHGLS